MNKFLRFIGIVGVFVITAVAWLVFGAVMDGRTRSQSGELRGQVSELWGTVQSQQAPRLTFEWVTEETEIRSETVDGKVTEIRERVRRTQYKEMSPEASDITADIDLDQRLKGLMWYALYDVDFQGSWSYTHTEITDGWLRLGFSFPDASGLYDDFTFVVNGEDLARTLRPEAGQVTHAIPVHTGDTVTLAIGYSSRGMDEWRYVPAPGVANLEDFALTMTTDFDDIDFPSFSMSPSTKSRETEGWTLAWTFEQIVTGHDIGMVMPTPIQPGQLAAKLSFSAPVSLLFFFLILFVLGTLRAIDIHPINYLFLGAAFFAFHLLFGYSVDHIHVAAAFALSSAVSMLLVVTYLRLVVSARFAFVEAAGAQLVYLVGFSLAYFWDGFTGLTITVLSILTLFLLMQLTGRLRWTELLAPKKLTAKPTPAPNGQPAG